jgi:hypothetical protein
MIGERYRVCLGRWLIRRWLTVNGVLTSSHCVPHVKVLSLVDEYLEGSLADAFVTSLRSAVREYRARGVAQLVRVTVLIRPRVRDTCYDRSDHEQDHDWNREKNQEPAGSILTAEPLHCLMP